MHGLASGAMKLRPVALAGLLATALSCAPAGDPVRTEEPALNASCETPAFDVAATTALQKELVAVLAGAADVTPGVRLADRASVANRAAARTYLGAQIERLGLTPLAHAYGTGTNVYAEIPSTTGARETVVLGAHYDSVARSPGANDNATGVSLVLAVGRWLSSVPCRSRNVVIVLFDQEEIGLVGSKAFSRKLKAEGAEIRSVHTVDQMGWDANGDGLIELERPDAGLAELYRSAANALGVSSPIVITSTPSSNHASFRPDFPAVGITEGYRSGDTTPDYHRPTDTFEKVSFPYLAATTTLVARVFADQLGD